MIVRVYNPGIRPSPEVRPDFVYEFADPRNLRKTPTKPSMNTIPTVSIPPSKLKRYGKSKYNSILFAGMGYQLSILKHVGTSHLTNHRFRYGFGIKQHEVSPFPYV